MLMTPSDRLPSFPTLEDAWLYLKNNGLRRSLMKCVAAYIAGRQHWYLTCEDLMCYARAPLPIAGLELRMARRDDLPWMHTFRQRVSARGLRAWLGPDYFFLVALMAGDFVAYRCLSTRVHPGVAGFIELEPGQLFMVAEFTAPPFRRRGITRAMAIAMTPYLLRLGFREVLGIHRTDNYDTIAAVSAKGIPRLGTVTRYHALCRTWFRYSPAADPWHEDAAAWTSPLIQTKGSGA